MRAVPPGFAEALAVSHTVTTRVEVLVDGSPVQAFDATSDAAVLAGSISCDSNADIRRRLDLTLADPTGAIVPLHIGDLLTPPNELRISQGINNFPLLPTGVFGLNSVDLADSGADVPIQLKGSDRSERISTRKWTSNYVITRGTGVAEAIGALLENRDPTLPPLNATPTTATTATLVLGEDDNNDPWKDAQDIAAASGLELLFDPDGVPVLRPVPDPAIDPVAAVYSEGPSGLLLSGQRSFSDDPGYNGIIVIGEGSEIADPYRVEVWDTDAASPTYYDPADPAASRWGPRPRFIRSELILTAGQARLTAQAELRKALGTYEDARFSGVPNPAHEAGDVIALQRNRIRLGGRYVLESFVLPLGPGAMTGQCRSRRLA